MEIIIGVAVVFGLGIIGLSIAHSYQQSARSRDIYNTTPATLESASREALIARARGWWNLAAAQDEVIRNILRWDHDISPSLSSEDREAAEKIIQQYNEAVKGGNV